MTRTGQSSKAAPRNARPAYIIEKTKGREPWRVMHFQRPSDATGAIIGHWPSRKQALTTARLLAGRTADVLIWKGL